MLTVSLCCSKLVQVLSWRMSMRAARISRNVRRFTDVDNVSGFAGSAGMPDSRRFLRRSRLVTTLISVLGRPLVATQSWYRSGGRQACSARPASRWIR